MLYLTSRRGATRYCSICGDRGHDVVSLLGFSSSLWPRPEISRGVGCVSNLINPTPFTSPKLKPVSSVLKCRVKGLVNNSS